MNGNYNRAGLSPTSGDGLNTAVRKLENWPTPQSHDAKSGMATRHGWGTQRNLNDEVLKYPTPKANDAVPVSSGQSARNDLKCAIVMGKTKSHQHPTPNIDSMCGGSGAYAQIMGNPNLSAEEKRNMASGNAGRLNPDWVEWLMFMPIGWTDIEVLNDRLVWLHPSRDPADLAPESPAYVPRLTHRRTNCASRIKGIGNAQYCATAFVAFAYGLAVLRL